MKVARWRVVTGRRGAAAALGAMCLVLAFAAGALLFGPASPWRGSGLAASPIAGGPTSAVGGQATFGVYVCREGDTPESIASRFSISVSNLRLANPYVPNDNGFYPGMPVVIPPPGWVPPSTPPAVTPAPRPLAYSEMVVGFVMTGIGSPWRSANVASMKEVATQLGITLKTFDPQGRLANQIDALKAFIQDPQVNVIVLDPIAGTGYGTLLQAAKDAHKVVIIENGAIDSDVSLYYTRIASDFQAEGRRAAAAMCDLLKNSTSRNVVELTDATSGATDEGRSAGFRNGMSDCGISITRSQEVVGDGTVAKAAMEALLVQSKDVQGVFAHTDDEAIGAIAAIKAAGLKPGKHIRLVSIGASAPAFKYLISGELDGAIECNPLLGPMIYEAALKGLNGDISVPKWIPAQEGQFLASQGADALRSFSPGHPKY